MFILEYSMFKSQQSVLQLAQTLHEQLFIATVKSELAVFNCPATKRLAIRDGMECHAHSGVNTLFILAKFG